MITPYPASAQRDCLRNDGLGLSAWLQFALFDAPAISTSTWTTSFTFSNQLLGSLIPHWTYGTSNFAIPFQCSPVSSACTAAIISCSCPCSWITPCTFTSELPE